MERGESLLAELTPENAGDWRLIGSVMKRLSSTSEVSPEGRLWHDVVLQVLEERGHPISSSHLHRIRRAYSFLEAGMQARGIPQERASIARISSVDLAERLFQMDAEAGFDALEACLDPRRRATKADIQVRYEEYLSAHPEKKQPMQVAWERRKARQEASTTAEASDPPVAQHATISRLLDQISECGKAVSAASEKDARTIDDLREELRRCREELAFARGQLKAASAELQELRGRAGEI